MWLEAVPESTDHSEKCPTCGSPVRRRTYGVLYAGAYVSDGKRVEIRRQPTEGYFDPVVFDSITQYFDGGFYRLWPSNTYFANGSTSLHRAVWRVAFGPIPKGCHIHHKDRNPANNAITNLECLPRSEHLSLSWHESKGQRPEGFSDLAKERAAEWHRSEAGRLWHRRHAKRSQGWKKWRREPKPCLYCGKTFQALVRRNGSEQKYCHPNCKAAHYRRRKASGIG